MRQQRCGVCQRGDSVEVIMPLKPDARVVVREKSVSDTCEFREYQIMPDEQAHAFENLMQLAPMAGFIVKRSDMAISKGESKRGRHRRETQIQRNGNLRR